MPDDIDYYRYRRASGGRLWHLVADNAGYRAEALCRYMPSVRWQTTRYDRETLESPEYGYVDDLCAKCRTAADMDTMSRRDLDAAIVRPARGKVRVGRSARDEAVKVGP